MSKGLPAFEKSRWRITLSKGRQSGPGRAGMDEIERNGGAHKHSGMTAGKRL